LISIEGLDTGSGAELPGEFLLLLGEGEEEAGFLLFARYRENS